MFRRNDYIAHESLVSPARQSAQVWRLIMGLTIASGVYLICNQTMFRTLYTWQGKDAVAFAQTLTEGSTPFAMYLMLLSFGFMTLGVAVALRVVHHRGLPAVLGDRRLFVQQLQAVLILLVLINGAIWLLPPWDMGAPLVPNMKLGLWVLLLPVSLLAVFVQVSAEEVLFRGYIQQQLAARFKSPLVWMVMPAVLFGFGHYLPDAAGSNATAIALWAVVFGLLMADLTARAGTLAPAIAVHLVNNVTAILIVSLPDDLSGLALYLSPFNLQDTEAVRAWLPVDFGFMIVSWLGARLAIRR
ncbi:CPBP family intramembrane metalloprotease [Roseobacter sp. YSTF-M11]|uniref:CPBP family intramembrane metalloprotease n=1 Tax=Roseobacter insulae TaxID=2859783 RepID=A0A9X1FRU9_9RHOB|nr:CPBP family intramembrane glutamic endopeptidase [Roseobacter insulae]MBW4706626.1 CPBP family intramembrane metalloprotease [Roseobacter insulae]